MKKQMGVRLLHSPCTAEVNTKQNSILSSILCVNIALGISRYYKMSKILLCMTYLIFQVKFPQHATYVTQQAIISSRMMQLVCV